MNYGEVLARITAELTAWATEVCEADAVTPDDVDRLEAAIAEAFDGCHTDLDTERGE